MKPAALRLISVILISYSLTTQAAEKKAKPESARTKEAKTQSSEIKATSNQTGKTSQIRYGSIGWNKDSSKLDSAYLFVRDRNTGKTAKVLLEETEPDSSQFAGQFSLDWKGGQQVDPEVFIPPRGMNLGDEDVKKFSALVNSGKVEKLPIVAKHDEKGRQVYDVFDTKEQAARARQAYENELRLAAEKSKRKLSKEVASDQVMAVADQTEKKQLLDALDAEASRREAERVRLEQIERQRTDELLRKFRQLSKNEQDARKAQAKKLVDQAMAHYQKGEFPQAQATFQQASELDPENKSTYFYYGVSLYRTEKFNEALVVMRLADSKAANPLEKKYYMGLIHFRLKELNAAKRIFDEVAATQHPMMAPSALFYKGVILFSEERYEEAKKPFEDVIDTSSDPALDKQAEEYIENIANMLAFKKLQEKKFLLTGTVGTSYDSNVLLSPDNDTSTGTATDEGGVRALASGGIEYRPLFTQKREWSAKFDSLTMYTFNSDLVSADPWLTTVSFPYTYKGMVWKKGLKSTIKPGFELLYMDPYETGTMEDILDSIFINWENTLVNRKDWFSTYTVEVRSDNSHLSLTSTGDNADAFKYTIKTAQTFLIGKEKKNALVAGAGYVRNQAEGGNKIFDRIDLSTTFVKPIKIRKWEASMNLTLAYYFIHYPDLADYRRDNDIAFTAGFSKPIKEWLTWGVSANYTDNTSNTNSYDYSKYTLGTTLTANYSL